LNLKNKMQELAKELARIEAIDKLKAIETAKNRIDTIWSQIQSERVLTWYEEERWEMQIKFLTDFEAYCYDDYENGRYKFLITINARRDNDDKKLPYISLCLPGLRDVVVEDWILIY